MRRDDLLPYPLAGADSRQKADAVGAAQSDPVHRQRRWLLPVTVVLSIALAAAGLWTLRQWQGERERTAALQEQLAAALAATQVAEAAAQDAVSDPLTVRQVASSEMYMASDGIGRFLDQAAAGTAEIEPRLLVATFFGVEMRTTGWTPLPGRNGTTGVLAQLDDPRNPTTIWVSARSSRTIDITAPSKQNCLALDVDRILDSARTGRQWGRGADTAPLRWWSDVYEFVPEPECGV